MIDLGLGYPLGYKGLFVLETHVATPLPVRQSNEDMPLRRV
jgi:hypothetical protein